MIREWGRGGRRFVMVLLGLVAVGGLAAALSISAGRGPDPVPARAVASAVPVADRPTEASVRACETAVARARDAVAAARPSYSHWSGHVHAQLDYDAGTATLEQTRERWASTKATADADLADFARAYAAFEAVQDGCAPPPGQAAGPGDQDDVMTQCRSEFVSVATAVAAAKAVVDDWAAHVEMMKGKEHTDPAQYGRMWRDMVRAAPPDLARFAQASLAMSDHVDCPRPS